jgi:hypothetical protein
MTDIDYRWWALFVGQVAVGLTLLFYNDAEYGKLLLASAFGQGVTGGIGPVLR